VLVPEDRSLIKVAYAVAWPFGLRLFSATTTEEVLRPIGILADLELGAVKQKSPPLLGCRIGSRA
jgi:hypothetical protein